jgi:hypothetical protein
VIRSPNKEKNHGYIAYLHKDRKSDFGVSFRIFGLRDGRKTAKGATNGGGFGIAYRRDG